MELLERQLFLDELDRRWRRAAGARGQAVFIAGEAGVGKSALIAKHLSLNAQAAALRGYCDALSTPRALGPVLELVTHLTSIGALDLSSASRGSLFVKLLAGLQRASPGTIVVLEDLHWADEATLDFVRYVSRRIQHTSCLLLATYRNDELSRSHPLRRLLGDLSGADVARLRLQPLSQSAVSTLAAAARQNGERIYTVTAGNPFLVRELLSSPNGVVPDTVRDSMMARLARCSPTARYVCELVALSPSRMEMDLAMSLTDGVRTAMDESIDRGVLMHEGDSLSYRHELARRVVEDALSPTQSHELHARILAALLRRGADLARLVHHARGAHDRAAVLEYAPQAGKRAAAMGAHREAAAHYAAALVYVDSLPSGARAELYELHAYECYLTSVVGLAIQSARKSLQLQHELGDQIAQGRLLRFISRQYWFMGDRTHAEQFAHRAIDVLEAAPPSRELAMAYSNRSQLSMLAARVDEAVGFGERAAALARSMNDVEIEAHALNNIGTVRLAAANEQGREALERSLELALAHDLHEHVARAYVNLATSATKLQDVERAQRYFSHGLAFCEERDLDVWTSYLRVHQARFDLDRGRWTQAAEAALALVNDGAATAITRIPALAVLAQVRARRGDPGVVELLDEALALAAPTGELQRIGRVAAARAEAAWYRDDADEALRAADMGLDRAAGHTDRWLTGELLFWKSRVAPVAINGHDIAEPYRLAVEGDWRAAAQAFDVRAMPYERALSLMNGDRAAKTAAKQILVGLGGAQALVQLEGRARMKRASRRRKETNDSTPPPSHGLTIRELEVLKLLGRGLTNAELAQRLFVSAKTIDHHVSSILAKLEARSRAHAVTAAFERGILGSTSGS